MGWRRSKIILYVAFAVSGLAIAGIRTVSLTLDHAAALRRAEQAAADMGAVLEEHARRVFENADLIADLAAGLAARSAESGDGAYPLHQELADLAGRMATSGGIAVLDAGGTPVAMSDRFPPALPDVTGQGWWKAHAERGQERVVGGLSADPATGEARFTYSRSLIGDDGRFRGVVLLSLRPAFFESFRFPAELDREAEIAMLRADGMLVARNPPLPPGAQLDRGRLLLRGTAKGGSAFREVSPADGVERLYAVRHLDRWPVLVAAGVSVDSALIAWRQGLAWSGAILALVLLFLAAAVWFGGRASDREARALQDAETANRRLAASLAD
ncbi:MAG TPA: cache domain-containing protein, partial [Azospirillaceae bacterium]|nr:cache domain-containing protein [Azospirillaceae bacterium]